MELKVYAGGAAANEMKINKQLINNFKHFTRNFSLSFCDAALST
jgi:hypothetical protein